MTLVFLKYIEGLNVPTAGLSQKREESRGREGFLLVPVPQMGSQCGKEGNTNV